MNFVEIGVTVFGIRADLNFSANIFSNWFEKQNDKDDGLSSRHFQG